MNDIHEVNEWSEGVSEQKQRRSEQRIDTERAREKDVKMN